MLQKLTVPVAIIIAGFLIAGSLFITRAGNLSLNNPDTNNSGSTDTQTIELPEVRATDHVLGDPRAQLVIYEFSDTECPFCKQFHRTMHTVIDTYGKSGDVAWVYRHFPIDQLHKKARKEAEATECAAELGGETAFWKYIDRLYEVTPSNDGLAVEKLSEIATYSGLDSNLFNNCLSSGKYAEKVEADYQEAVAALGRGTPHSVLVSKEELNEETIRLVRVTAQELPPQTFVLSPDNKKLVMVGALPYDLLELIIETALGKK